MQDIGRFLTEQGVFAIHGRQFWENTADKGGGLTVDGYHLQRNDENKLVVVE